MEDDAKGRLEAAVYEALRIIETADLMGELAELADQAEKLREGIERASESTGDRAAHI